jgi:hypothetical protein
MKLATLLLTATLSLGACSHTTTARTDEPIPTTAGQPYRAPEDVLRDPAKRFELMNSLARSIYSKTKKADDAQYYGQIRPNVLEQLRAAGFREEDAEQILTRADRVHPQIAKGGGAPARAP